VVEAVLGREPLGTGVLRAEASHAFPDALADALLFVAAAKGDAQAVRLVVALSGASAAAVQPHGAGQTLPGGLAAALARLMSKPSITQQLNLLRMVASPELFETGAPEIEVFLRVASARFDLRIDGAVNDTAAHAAAYTYDHDTLLALLARDGGAGVDTPDSLGRTALHYAADVQDQLQGLVNVFAEPPVDLVPVAAQRTASALRMVADVPQAAVVRELEPALRYKSL
jgi:hypothetical protein